MKIEKSTVVSFGLLIAIATLYRIMPGRPFGFAPQIAMAIFAGSVIKNYKLSYLLPVLSMLFSDIFYEVLYQNHLSTIAGFYSGQFTNYIFFALLTFIGFGVKKENLAQIVGGSVIGATVYFLISNFSVWLGGGLDINNIPYPKTFAGLSNCFVAAIPFYKMSIYSTLFFNAVLFGGYYFINKMSSKALPTAA